MFGAGFELFVKSNVEKRSWPYLHILDLARIIYFWKNLLSLSLSLSLFFLFSLSLLFFTSGFLCKETE